MPLAPEDHLAILNHLARYAHLIDVGHDPEAWADCFTADAEFDARPVVHCFGRADLVEFCRKVQGGTRHWTSNAWIDGDGDAATAHTYLLSLGPGVAPKPGPTAVYHDRFVRTGDGWRIAYRKVEFEEPPVWTDPGST